MGVHGLDCRKALVRRSYPMHGHVRRLEFSEVADALFRIVSESYLGQNLWPFEYQQLP